MNTIDLRAIECPLSGETGIVLSDMRICSDNISAATTGILVAHDIIEHQQGAEKIGGIGDELIALGAVAHTRGQWGDMQRDGRQMYAAHETLAFDVANLATYYFEGVPIREQLKPLDSGLVVLESFIDDVIEEAREMIPDELLDSYDIHVTPSELEDYLRACKTLMQHGAVMCQKRFNNSDFESNSTFWRLADELDKVTDRDLYVDELFRVRYDQHTVVVQEEYEFLEYDEQYA